MPRSRSGIGENAGHVRRPHHGARGQRPRRRLRWRPAAGPLGDPADRRLLPLRELPRRAPAVGGPAARPCAVLLHRRPARHHPRAGPEGTPRAHPARRGPAAGDGHRPAAVGDLHPEPGAGARPGRLGAAVHDRLRRGPPDDPVQGQVRQGWRGRGERRAVHLPGAPGGRHPALPAALRPGRRGPAPAPRADPRSRPAVQQPLQEDAPAARALHPQGDRQDRRPAEPHRQDVQVAPPARPGSSRCSTTPR